jgi:chromosome segregation ATPase
MLKSPKSRDRNNRDTFTYAGTAGSVPPRHEYADQLDTLEASEQTLIEHLRTAGLKKTRECQLIDEVLNMRKNRRQVFSMLTKDVSNTRELQEGQQARAKELTQDLQQNIKELQEEIEKKDYALRNIQKELKKKLQDVHEKYRRVMKDEVNSVKAGYEKTLSTLEGKIEQVQRASSQNIKNEEDELSNKLQIALEENNRRQSEKYSASMQK